MVDYLPLNTGSYEIGSNSMFGDPVDLESSEPWFINSGEEEDFADEYGATEYPTSTSVTQETSPDTEDSFWTDLWTWSKSDQGVSVIAPTIKSGFDTYISGKATESAEDLAADSHENYKELLELKAGYDKEYAILLDELKGPSEAEFKDERISKHNTSINSPSNMGTRVFK